MAQNCISLEVNALASNLVTTSLVNIVNSEGKYITCRVLLDTGATANFISNALLNKLNLPKRRCSLSISGIDNLSTTSKYIVTVTFKSLCGKYERTIQCLSVPVINNYVPAETIPRERVKIPANIRLADPDFYKPAAIDVLLGTGPTLSLLCIGQIHLTENNVNLYLQKTLLGWVIGGSIETPKINCLSCNFIDLQADLVRFWDIEEGVSDLHLSPEEVICEQHFVDHIKRNSEGRYVVALPFKANSSNLGESRSIALKRLYYLLNKLKNNSELMTEYSRVLEEYIELGHMSDITGVDDGKGYYMPHHAVFKESSLTTKTRVVFDASAKTSSGVSLNDILMVGPKIQDDLITLLLRFRLHTYVLTADLEKMYRQFLVQENDRVYHKLLWKDAKGIKTFQLNTITFGVASAPYLATRCLHQLAEDEKEKFPLAAKILKNDMYVDDLLTGTSSIEEAQKIRKELSQLVNSARLNFRQWASNEPEILKNVGNNSINSDFELSKYDTVKTLGISWNAKTDSINYSVRSSNDRIAGSKRAILSEIAKIFDPLGLLGPVILQAKTFMQKLWKEKVDWDESISQSLFTEWQRFYSQLGLLKNMSFRRQVILPNSNRIELHGFCDASRKGYGACIYFKSFNGKGEVSTYIYCSKSRVAPLKVIDIHRLELCAAQLLTKVYQYVINSIHTKINKVYLWSDSEVTLHWIKTPPYLLKTFVANRVNDIQSKTKNVEWRYIPTSQNPADALSRGQNPQQFILNKLWLVGPQWLKENQNLWPKSRQPSLNSVLPETKETVCFTITSSVDWNLFERYSSFIKLKRIIAYCLRLSTKSKHGKCLLPQELIEAEKRIIKITQASEFATDLINLSKRGYVDNKSKLLPLQPFFDQDGILRVGGRLKNCNITYSQRHPILLPKSHHVSNILISDCHLHNYHSGIQTTLNILRQKYWILDGRNQVRKIIRKCILCWKVNPPNVNYIMGNLPSVRVNSARPFCNVGVDYCGPFYIKEKKYRNKNRIKVYVAVFVCLVVKAVHLELVSDMTTEGFIAAFRRFSSRRGLPQNVYSDNGTNFVGASKELRELYVLLNSNNHKDSIINFSTNKGIIWHFIPPLSPHFGGQWEVSVKLFKHHLKRVVSDKLFDYVEFETFVVEVEAIINSRPLTPLSNDPNDIQVLTPAHFLIGDNLRCLPESDFSQLPVNRLSNWQHIQKIRQHFWTRWHKEYLNELNLRRKWITGGHPINQGTVVLLRDDNAPSMHWKLGVVSEIHPGSDGIIRTVTVKTSNSEFKRNVKSLAPLPIDTRN